MKKNLVLWVSLLLSTPTLAADLESVEQRASYTLGADLANNFTQQGITIDADAFMLGLQDTLNERPARLTEEQMNAAIAKVKESMEKKQQASRAKQGQENLAEGKAFMQKNAQKDGVKTLPNGIQYQVLTAGKGESPTAEDTIFAHYEGAFIDGEVFDSSFERGSPLKFKMSNVIKGWGEVLKKMQPGAKWKVVIPPELAYGEKGAGEAIGPHETLVFTIELIQFTQE